MCRARCGPVVPLPAAVSPARGVRLMCCDSCRRPPPAPDIPRVSEPRRRRAQTPGPGRAALSPRRRFLQGLRGCEELAQCAVKAPRFLFRPRAAPMVPGARLRAPAPCFSSLLSFPLPSLRPPAAAPQERGRFPGCCPVPCVSPSFPSVCRRDGAASGECRGKRARARAAMPGFALGRSCGATRACAQSLRGV